MTDPISRQEAPRLIDWRASISGGVLIALALVVALLLDTPWDSVSTFRISPRNAGLADAKPEDLIGGDAVENAAHIRAVLQGNQGPLRDIVLLNAAAALLVAGKATTLRDGVALAADSIDSGKAMKVLEALVQLSRDKV